jgi:hypothetical protein
MRIDQLDCETHFQKETTNERGLVTASRARVGIPRVWTQIVISKLEVDGNKLHFGEPTSRKLIEVIAVHESTSHILWNRCPRCNGCLQQSSDTNLQVREHCQPHSLRNSYRCTTWNLLAGARIYGDTPDECFELLSPSFLILQPRFLRYLVARS